MPYHGSPTNNSIEHRTTEAKYISDWLSKEIGSRRESLSPDVNRAFDTSTKPQLDQPNSQVSIYQIIKSFEKQILLASTRSTSLARPTSRASTSYSGSARASPDKRRQQPVYNMKPNPPIVRTMVNISRKFTSPPQPEDHKKGAESLLAALDAEIRKRQGEVAREIVQWRNKTVAKWMTELEQLQMVARDKDSGKSGEGQRTS